MKMLLVLFAVCLSLTGFAAELKIDFTAEKPWEFMRNHGNRVKISHKEVKGKKATIVSLNHDVSGTDTAFSLGTPLFPVKGKKTITVKFTFCTAAGMKDFTGGGFWSTGVRWCDNNQKEVATFTRIPLPPATGKFQTVTQEIDVPEKALNACVHFGFDTPNITKNILFVITDVVITY
jgi:hypothetical protein